MTRRTQQFECYAAEHLLDAGVPFADVAAAQRWVDDLRDTPWWHLQGYSLHVLRIEVGPGRPGGSVGWLDKEKNAGRIELAPTHLNTMVALHEVAHVLAEAVHGSDSHDPAWARTFLTLVSCALGSETYLLLKASFDEHGVCYDAAPSPRASGIAL